MPIHIDFETRSTVDLRKVGVDVYSNHPSTEVLCVGHIAEDEDHAIMDMPNSTALCGTEYVAHNAAFEIAIWNNVCVPKYGWKPTDASKWECTMTMAYAMGLPGSLDNAAAAVGIKEGKDQKGHRIMLQLCKPRKILENGFVIWWDKSEVPEKYEALYAYCLQDVRLERDLYKRLRPLSPAERKVWILDQEINNRGVRIDVQSAKKAHKMVEEERTRLNNEIQKKSDGHVSTANSHAALKRWLRIHGIKTDSTDKSAVAEMLSQSLPDSVRSVLHLRQEAGKSSTAKIKAMVESAGGMGRVRGTLQYHGAATGRWAGRKIQFQNLPRPKLSPDEISFVFDVGLDLGARSIEATLGSPLSVISDCIRGFLIPAEGHDFIGCDFSQIEARVTAWLAGELDALATFERGEDIYVDQATKIFRCKKEEVGETRRFAGKTSVLACGFGGGNGAFKVMSSWNKDVNFTDKQIDQIVKAWRDANPNIVNMWYAIDKAAKWAIEHPGEKISTHKVTYIKKGSFLLCRLPSGREICYPYPRVEMIKTSEAYQKKGGPKLKETVTAKWVDSVTRKWDRRTLWHGTLCENICQAVARDILVHAMQKVEEQADIVMHVHDEFLVEVPSSVRSRAHHTIENLACAGPTWAKGLPLAAKAWRGKRYQK